MNDFSEEVVRLIAAIPPGRVASYGQIAAMAGNPRAARQVVRLLNSQSGKQGLPWHRLLNREGKIALPAGEGFDLQKALLLAESVPVDAGGRVADGLGPAFERYRWLG